MSGRVYEGQGLRAVGCCARLAEGLTGLAGSAVQAFYDYVDGASYMIGATNETLYAQWLP